MLLLLLLLQVWQLLVLVVLLQLPPLPLLLRRLQPQQPLQLLSSRPQHQRLMLSMTLGCPSHKQEQQLLTTTAWQQGQPPAAHCRAGEVVGAAQPLRHSSPARQLPE